MGRRSRRRGKRGPLKPAEWFIREAWFLALLLNERLPACGRSGVDVAACSTLADRFVVACAAEIEATIAAVKGKLGNTADLDDHAEAIVVVLIPWARASSGIRFHTTTPPPYR